MKRIPLLLSLVVFLVGCAGIQPPPGEEKKTTFVQQSDKSYREAYRIIAKQMRSCYRAIGLLGNGYEVMADLDSDEKKASIEVYYIGFAGAQKPEDSIFSRTVHIASNGTGSTITTTGMTPMYVYETHLTIPRWLNGEETCSGV